MSKKLDYTKYSKEPIVAKEPVESVETVEAEIQAVEPVIEEPIVEEPVVESVEPVVEPVIEEPVVEPVIDEPEPIIGVVTDCLKLNVREFATKNADILGVIDAATELVIIEEESTKDFYKICTSTGLEGYCMKKFISIMP